MKEQLPVIKNKEIGRRRQSYYLKGKFYDDVYMDILKSERQ